MLLAKPMRTHPFDVRYRAAGAWDYVSDGPFRTRAEASAARRRQGRWLRRYFGYSSEEIRTRTDILDWRLATDFSDLSAERAPMPSESHLPTYDVFVVGPEGTVPKKDGSWLPGGQAEQRKADNGRPYLLGHFVAGGNEHIHFKALPTPSADLKTPHNRPVFNLFILNTFREIPTDGIGRIIDQRQPVWKNKSKSKNRTFLRCQITAIHPPVEIQLWHTITPKKTKPKDPA